MRKRKKYSYMADLEDVERRLVCLERELKRLSFSGAPKLSSYDRTYNDYDNIKGSGAHPEALDAALAVLEIKDSMQEAQEERERLMAYIKQLEDFAIKWPDNKRAVFYLREYAGFRLPEIAEKLCLSYDYVRVISAKVKSLEDLRPKMKDDAEFLISLGIEISKG